MALSRGSRYEPVNYWPGFVDALSTMLLVIIFLLSVFMLAQFFLSREVTGKDEALGQAQPADRGTDRSAGAGAHAKEPRRDQDRDAHRDARQRRARSRKRLKDPAAAGRGRRRRPAGSASAAAGALDEQKDISARALAQVDVLNQQIAALRQQLGAIEDALSASEAANKESQSKIADLGARLNVALAQKVQELDRYRSDFFGRLRQILGSRPDIRVVGDRFVFESSVLFDVGKADISPAGKQSLDTLAAAVLDLEREIPPDIPWILRVDGHTDSRPVTGGGQYKSNWELSAARAVAVVQYLISKGVEPEPASRRGLRRIPADRPGNRRSGARPQPAYRTEADGAVSGSTWVLRDFDVADLPAVIDLWVAAWSETGFAIDFEARRPWLEERLRAHRRSGGTIVVGLDASGRPAGFVTLDPATGTLDSSASRRTSAGRGSPLGCSAKPSASPPASSKSTSTRRTGARGAFTNARAFRRLRGASARNRGCRP